MPPTERSVMARGALFAPGKSFRNYIGHLRKGCILLGCDANWAAKAIYAAASGLRKARKGVFKFPNFSLSKDVFRIVDFLLWDREFDQLIFLAFLFPHRVPSEALALRRAFRDARLFIQTECCFSPRLLSPQKFTPEGIFPKFRFSSFSDSTRVGWKFPFSP